MTRILPLFAALLGVAGLVMAFEVSAGAAENGQFKVIAPAMSRDGIVIPAPRPTPTAVPVYQGDVAAITLPSARLDGNAVVERRDTQLDLDGERLQEPTSPSRIAWYDRFGQPGTPGRNSIFAAHVDYVHYGNGPFHDLTSARLGDTLTVLMDNGLEYYYTVLSVQVIHLAELDMTQVVYPPLAPNRERITLISCGGTFVPYPTGGGEYLSRVVLVAERIIE